jgi:uncharacterized membrane protein HdeD (DUF308 family)
VPDSSFAEIAGLFVRRWWVVLLRGLAAIAFGIAAFAWPHITIPTLVLLFGYYALVQGVISLLAAIRRAGDRGDRLPLAMEGIAGVWIGIITLRVPAITGVVLVFLVSTWAMVTGVLRIAEGIRLRKEITGEVWLALSGIVTVIFAVLLIFWPSLASRPGLEAIQGAINLPSILAGYAVVLGVLEIVLGFELRGSRRRLTPGTA